MAATQQESSTNQFAFQAEVRRLLDLLAHSLYQSKEIAIRELISNASDALDKARFQALSTGREERLSPAEIRITLDKDKGVLTIADSGIGMTHDEMIDNLGTIAKSGSLEFVNKLSGDRKQDLSLIGQFGVGFYSAFMLADRVEVISRSVDAAESDSAWRWVSEGVGSFTVEEAEAQFPHGTQVGLHLKEDVKSEFGDAKQLERIVKRYSGFVPHPIFVEGTRVNEVRPIWVEPKSQITQEQYIGFFQHLTHRTAENPLWHIHLSVDSPIQFHAILYCPAMNPELLGFGRLEHGLNLCAKRVLVQHECRELLPEYLRFLVGIVDSQDLPLNISRETLQDARVLQKIKGMLVKRSLDRMAEHAAEDPEGYQSFYRQFGAILKEGIHEETDNENRKRIAKLLRFLSTKSESDSQTVGLDLYLERRAPEQDRIYYLGGPDLASLKRSPNLEVFAERGIEVLLLTDPVDEFVLGRLGEYEGKKLTSVDASDLDLPPAPETREKPKEEAETPGGFERVLTAFRLALKDRVAEVRESKRLADSPCCLVNPDGTLSSQVQKILQMTHKDFQMTKRILEVNPRNKLVKRLATLSANSENDDFIKECGLQLYSNALMLEGMFESPQDMVERVQRLMEAAADNRSSIIRA